MTIGKNYKAKAQPAQAKPAEEIPPMSDFIDDEVGNTFIQLAKLGEAISRYGRVHGLKHSEAKDIAHSYAIMLQMFREFSKIADWSVIRPPKESDGKQYAGIPFNDRILKILSEQNNDDR